MYHLLKKNLRHDCQETDTLELFLVTPVSLIVNFRKFDLVDVSLNFQKQLAPAKKGNKIGGKETLCLSPNIVRACDEVTNGYRVHIKMLVHLIIFVIFYFFLTLTSTNGSIMEEKKKTQQHIAEKLPRIWVSLSVP